jgi:hypothetical protein
MTTYSIINLENPTREVITKTDEDGKIWFIPAHPDNVDYQSYLKWKKNQTEVSK